MVSKGDGGGVTGRYCCLDDLPEALAGGVPTAWSCLEYRAFAGVFCLLCPVTALQVVGVVAAVGVYTERIIDRRQLLGFLFLLVSL